MNICVVCSGNICRSPFVEHILRRELGEAHHVCSAGILGICDSPAYKECILLAPGYGVDLTMHRSQGLTSEIIAQSDLMVGLTRRHCLFLLELGAMPEKVKLLGDYLPEGKTFDVGKLGKVRKGGDIPDPVEMPAEDVRPVLDVLEIAAIALARKEIP